MMSSNKPISDRLGSVKAPNFIFMGGADPDFPSPRKEAEAVQQMLGGKSRVEDPQAVFGLLPRVLPELTHGT